MKAKLKMNNDNEVLVEIDDKEIIRIPGDGCNNGDLYYDLKKLLEAVNVEVQEDEYDNPVDRHNHN